MYLISFYSHNKGILSFSSHMLEEIRVKAIKRKICPRMRRGHVMNHVSEIVLVEDAEERKRKKV